MLIVIDLLFSRSFGNRDNRVSDNSTDLSISKDCVSTKMDDLNEVTSFGLLVNDKVELDDVIDLEGSIALLDDIEVNRTSFISNRTNQVDLLDILLIHFGFFRDSQNLSDDRLLVIVLLKLVDLDGCLGNQRLTRRFRFTWAMFFRCLLLWSTGLAFLRFFSDTFRLRSTFRARRLFRKGQF